MTTAMFYSLDEQLKAKNRGFVTLEQAREVFGSYTANLKPDYVSGEAALAETLFGFSRSKDEFLEFCVHARDAISCKLSIPSGKRGILARIFQPVIEREEILSSRSDALGRLNEFFTLSTEQLRASINGG